MDAPPGEYPSRGDLAREVRQEEEFQNGELGSQKAPEWLPPWVLVQQG